MEVRVFKKIAVGGGGGGRFFNFCPPTYASEKKDGASDLSHHPICNNSVSLDFRSGINIAFRLIAGGTQQ